MLLYCCILLSAFRYCENSCFDWNCVDLLLHVQLKFFSFNKSNILSDSRPHRCWKCGKAYKWACNLGRHVKFECNTEPKFQCQICQKKFKQKVNLRTHLKFVHGYFNPISNWNKSFIAFWSISNFLLLFVLQ